MTVRPPWSLLLLLAASLPATAGAGSLEEALRRCASNSEPVQRLSCFDAVVSTLPRFEADRFGLTADIEQQRDPRAVHEAKDETLSGKISALGQTPRGKVIFTLDNQQVWVEAEANSHVQFAVGEEVRIEHSAMSALWLVADHHRRVRVKRLR